MFLRKLRIQNLRAIQDLELGFDAPGGGTRKWTLILGENGCGKSTVLRATALVLAGTDALPHLLGAELDSWVRGGADAATITAEVRTAEDEPRRIALTLRRGETVGAVYKENEESLALLDAALKHTTRSYMAFGYGASRRLNTDPDSAFKSNTRVPVRARAVATLFSPDAVLDPLESWVIRMDYQKRLGEGRQTVETIARELMPGVEFYDIDPEKQQLLFKTPDGIVPLTQLSDGYQNVAAWCGDLLRWINSTFKNYKDPLQARGLLLVDEIDLHLHPVWQRRLRSFFDNTFPNMQFVVTTHSPLTVQQAGEGELFVMRRPGPKAGPVIEAFDGTPNTMMIHQLLLSPIFNLGTMDSYEVQKKRKEYRALKKKKKEAPLNPRQQKKLESLAATISDLPDIGGGLTAYERRQDERLQRIEAAIKTGGKKKPRKKK